jgi:hypothetical protein
VGISMSTVYRLLFLAAVLALTYCSWFIVGGTAGAVVFVVGFLLMWAATRVANHAFAGFLLGDDLAPEHARGLDEPDDAPADMSASPAPSTPEP